jgi:hypothetical protein
MGLKFSAKQKMCPLKYFIHRRKYNQVIYAIMPTYPDAQSPCTLIDVTDLFGTQYFCRISLYKSTCGWFEWLETKTP